MLPVQINKCTKECLFSSWIWNNALLFIFAGLWLVSNHGAPHTILFQHDITHWWRKKPSNHNSFWGLLKIAFHSPKQTRPVNCSFFCWLGYTHKKQTNIFLFHNKRNTPLIYRSTKSITSLFPIALSMGLSAFWIPCTQIFWVTKMLFITFKIQ